MKYLGIGLTIFGVIIIIFPEFLAILIGSFFVFLGVNIMLMGKGFSFGNSKKKEDYVKFGKYKIFR